MNRRFLMLACAVTGWMLPGPHAVGQQSKPATVAEQDTLWVMPHTHWEGAVFYTREEYLRGGMEHIIHALQLLDKYPDYTFILDQVAYVKPFLERFPEQEEAFRKFVAQGRLELVLGMDSMPDVNKPGGESIVRQIQYGKGYYRRRLGVEVTVAWLADTFGHPAQLPQILKLGGYKSFWFFRGVPNAQHPSEFLWEGIDGTRMPSVWMPDGYGIFWGAPGQLPDFEAYAQERFDRLTLAAHGRHDRAAPSGADVTDPEDQLPEMVKAQQESGHSLGFKLRFGVPSQFDAVVARRADQPVFKGELNPIFQGTYSSRIELKQETRLLERLLTTAEKLGALSQWLGTPLDNATLWKAWEYLLFNEAHDIASGVMTDHVYADVKHELDCSKRLAESLIDTGWEPLATSIDTRGTGIPIVVFNTLGWKRDDIAEVILGFAQPDVKRIALTDPAGADVPVQILRAVRGRDGGIREARIAFTAHEVPAMGYAVYHATPQTSAGPAQEATHVDAPGQTVMENEQCRLEIDSTTGAITSLIVKDGNWNALSGPANVIARQEDKGDLWEPYHTLDGGSRFAMTNQQAVPQSGATTVLSSAYQAAKPGVVRAGAVFSEFSVAHPFDNGQFTTTVRLAKGSRRIEVATQLVNNSKYVRYQGLFPTSIKNGRNFQSIAFGAMERPAGIEFPAQDWVDYGDGARGVALLNIGLPGNLVNDGTMLLSLLRSQTLGGYDEGGGPSDTGFELGQERTFRYAMMPHRGDWRAAEVYREGMEFGHPLICRKASAHAGPLPARWGFLSLSHANAAVSSLQCGKEGTLLLRVYEATGQSTPGVALTLATEILSAGEVNLLEDPIAPLKPERQNLVFDLAPYQIRTFSLKLRPAPPVLARP